jgi:hypothetical protein
VHVAKESLDDGLGVNEKRKEWMESVSAESKRCEGESCGRRCTRTFTKKTRHGILCITCFCLLAEVVNGKRRMR